MKRSEAREPEDRDFISKIRPCRAMVLQCMLWLPRWAATRTRTATEIRSEWMRSRTLKALTLSLLLLGPGAATGEPDEAGVVDSKSITKDLLPGGMAKTRSIRPRPRINLRVEFELDSARLTPQARQQLDQLAGSMASPELQVYSFDLIGHTDASGAADYNDQLSIRRADAVRTYLARSGIEASRLGASGKGESELLLPDDPANGANRRVEVVNVGSTNP